MSMRTAVATPWHWGTTPSNVSHARRAQRAGGQEMWAGAVYLMVWSLLWLAVIVTVLSPLDVLFGGAR